MAGSSTARSVALHLRPTQEADLDYVVAAEAAPDAAPFLAPSPREEHAGFLADPGQGHGRAILRQVKHAAFEVMSILRPEWAA